MMRRVAPVRRRISGQAPSSTCRPLRGSCRPAKTMRCSRSAGSASGGISTPFGMISYSPPSQCSARFPRVLGDGDAAVEPVCEEAPHRLRELHPAEVAARVERPDHRPAVQRERADARDRRHRLVQVQQVELLAREHLPDARDRARAEDDVRQRAVRGHDHGAADRDHVVGRVAVAAVPRVQDARELPGRIVPHDHHTSSARARSASDYSSRVLDDDAPERPPVRHDDPDLHPRPLSSAGRCLLAHHTTGRSSGSLCRPSARLRRSRCTSSSTPRSSATSGARSSRRSASPAPCSAAAFTIFNFLAYGTTAVVARASGAGQQERAARLAAQALWLAVGIGVVLSSCSRPSRAAPRALGGHGRSGDYALTYFRIAATGLACGAHRRSRARATCAVSRTCGGRSRSSSSANVANLVLELALRLRLPLGHRGLGRRHRDRAGRDGHRVRRRAAPRRTPARGGRACAEMRPMLRIGRQIFVRTTAL